MVSERLKNELAELRAKMLDIREFDASSSEHLRGLFESIKNLQAVMTEMVLNQAEAHMPLAVAAVSVPSGNAVHAPGALPKV